MVPELVVVERPDGLRDVRIEGESLPARRHVTTTYPVDLIEDVFAVKGPWTCDEIARDEGGTSYLELSVTSYLDPADLAGKRLLDFGCGAGASTMRLTRLLPETELVGVELEADLLRLARRRAAHHGASATFQLSPSPNSLPDVGPFDVINFEAVYEHLLPDERQPILEAVWGALKPGGVLLVSELPHRWFPIEWHTTRLPFINYLPGSLVQRLLNRSDRYVPGHDWDWWLRRGIRGGTQRDIVNRLTDAEALRPSREGRTTWADVWLPTAHYIGNLRLRRSLYHAFRVLDRLEPMEPVLSLALRKHHY